MTGGRGRRLAGLAQLAMWAVSTAVAADLPFTDTFEGGTPGSLSARGAWQTSPDASVQVQSSIMYAGSRAAICATNSMMSLPLSDPMATNVWVDFVAKVRRRTPPRTPSLSADAAAGFYFDSTGRIVVHSNATWVTLPVTNLPNNVWRRFSVHLDYGTRTWALFIAGDSPNALASPVATNLVFAPTGTNTYLHRFSVKN